jgi:hypothetical protein
MKLLCGVRSEVQGDEGDVAARSKITDAIDEKKLDPWCLDSPPSIPAYEEDLLTQIEKTPRTSAPPIQRHHSSMR